MSTNNLPRTYVLDGRTATAHFPGIGRYVRNLAAAMPDHLTPAERLCILTPSEGSFGPPHPQVSYVPTDATPFALRQQWQIPQAIRRAAPDAVVYHSPYYLMPYRSGLPTVLTLHDLIALTLPEAVSPRARRFFRIAVWLALRSAQRIIVGSDETRADLVRHFGIDGERVTVIPYAPAAHFQPQPDDVCDAVRRELGLPPEYLLYLGINKPHKNLVRLVEAYANVGGAPPLVIGGAWDERYPEAKQRVERLGLTGHVHFIGRVDDAHLPALYSACTLFVFPSLYEGFGLPVVEAMACGAPVIWADSPGLRGAAGNAGLRVDPRDTTAIADAIRVLLADPARRHQLGEEGLAHARTLTWSGAAAATLDVYRRLAPA